MKIDFESAVNVLKNADKVLVLSHANPDGDAIGSSHALAHALKKLGKQVKVKNADEYAEKFDYITKLIGDGDFEESFIVTTDVADAKLLGKAFEEKYAGRIDLSIDHHGTNRLFAKETYLEADSASACEIVYNIIESLGAPIDSDIANCLFTGVSTDTGCFRYSNVTPRTHLIAAKLIEAGADHSRINTKMFETKKLCALELERLCLDSMKLFENGQACFFVITKEMAEKTGCSESDFDALVALSRQIEGVKVGVTLKEKADGTFKASVRTGEEVDASVICQAFGGGGHTRASGCAFGKDSNEAVEKLLVEIKKQL